MIINDIQAGAKAPLKEENNGDNGQRNITIQALSSKILLRNKP